MSFATVTRIMHSRGFAVSIAAAASIAAIVFFYGGNVAPIRLAKGVAFPSPNEWFPSADLDFWIGMAGSAVAVVILLLLNKIYNVLRSMTSLYIAFFALMQLATPELLTQFYTGTLAVIVVPMCMLLLLACYRHPSATKNVFLIFMMLSAAATTQYCYIWYLPVFLIGLGQMRIFNGRTLMAAILGIITPWWILFGFGIVNPLELKMPVWSSIFSELGADDATMLLIVVSTTTLLLLLCYTLNIFKTIAYNARSRAINGFTMMLSLFTVVAMCVDFRNIVSYVPLLNFCASLQAAHFFATRRADRSCIAVGIIFAIYIAYFICQTII